MMGRLSRFPTMKSCEGGPLCRLSTAFASTRSLAVETQMRQRQKPVLLALMPSRVWELAQNRLVLDLAVVGQQKGFAEDKRKCAVSLKRQREAARGDLGSGALHDAQIA